MNDLLGGGVKVLPKLEFSYHRPILISLTNISHYQETKLFRFECVWHVDSSYYDCLKNNWDLNAPITINLKSFQKGIMRWKLEQMCVDLFKIFE